MKTKAIATIIVTLFLANMLSMAFNIAPVAALDNVVGLWHFDTDFGTALNFDNVDDYVEVDFSSSLNFTAAGQDFSFEAWINSAVEDYDYIFQQLWDGTGRTWLYLTPDGAVSSYIGGKDTMTATGVITPRKWHHVALTFDKVIESQGGTLKIYVDGEMKASSTRTFDALAQVGYRIGIDGTQWPFNGMIDEVRISNVTRTSFDLSKPLTVDDYTVALWHFDEGAGTIAYDSSTNNNDGTLVNMDPTTAWVDTTLAIDSSGYNNHGTIYGPAWTPYGAYDGALDFDGTNDYVEILHSTSLDITDGITVEAWVLVRGTDTYNTIEGKGAPYDQSWVLDIYSGGWPRFSIYDPDDGWQTAASSEPISLGTWYHLTGTYDGSTVNIYVDGELKGSLVFTGSIRSTTEALRIGSWGGIYEFFNGIIDEVRVWNTALSPSEVYSSYASKRKVLPTAGPVIFTSAFRVPTGAESTIKIYIWPSDPSVTIDHVTTNPKMPYTPKTTSGDFSVVDTGDWYIEVKVWQDATDPCKTIHLWLYVAKDGVPTGEHVGVNVQFR